MIISGLASTPHLDHVRHVVDANAFTESIARRGVSGPSGVRLLAFHDSDKPVGRITELKPTKRGLVIRAEIDEDISYGKDLAVATKAAGGLNFSVGFRLQDADFDVAPDGEEYLHILKADLFEVSVVVFPMNETASMTEVKGDSFDRLLGSVARLKIALEELNK